MSTDIMEFNFNGQTLRTFNDKMTDEPWFVAKDVCRVLGTAVRDIPEILDEDERGVGSIDTPGGNQWMTVVNEPGLYSLILKSRKPQAKAFKRWVTWEVLPSIRKHGGYFYGQEHDDDPQMLMAKALKVADSVIAEKDKKLEANRAMLEDDLSVDSYRGFYLQDYLTQSQKIRLGQAATRFRKTHGIPVKRQERLVENRYGNYVESEVNLYPKWILDAATEEVLGRAYAHA